MTDEMRADEAPDKRKAKGSRENVDLGTDAGNPMERGSGQESDPDRPIKRGRDEAGGGITDRPLPEEERTQESLPPRGQKK